MDRPSGAVGVRHFILDDDDIEVRADDEGTKVHSITVFKNEKARGGPDLSLKGLSVANYRKNPIVQWAHDTMGHTASGGLPIGRTVKIDKGEARMRAEFTFLQDDPFAERVENAWNQGFIRAASVSWRAIESERVEDEDQDLFGGGWRDTKSELLEWSLVPVPADPDALRESFVRGFYMATRDLPDDAGPDAAIGTPEWESAVEDAVDRYLQRRLDNTDDPDPEPVIDPELAARQGKLLADASKTIAEINASLKGE